LSQHKCEYDDGICRKCHQKEQMKTTYTAWAVQVLRDGEWEVLTPLWRGLSDSRVDARVEAQTRREHYRDKTRIRKVRVTVETLETAQPENLKAARGEEV